MRGIIGRSTIDAGIRILAAIFLSGIFLTGSIQSYAQADPATNSTDIDSFGYPLPAGEKLSYSIDWDPPWYLFFFPNMQAGTAELSIEGESEFEGRKAIKIRFEIYSSGVLSKLSGKEIHDDFVFLSDPETLCTLNFSKKIREGKRKRQIDVDYMSDTGQLHIIEYDEAVSPRKLKKDKVKDDIPSCVRDPFSALYHLRRLPMGDDSVITSYIGHDDVVKEVKTRVEALEVLDTTSGKILSWRIRTIALMGSLFKKGGEFKLWLSADNRQVPLQFEAKVPLGRVRGKLVETGDTTETGNEAPQE
ncbi:MAG: DUF3108 domain-containing protein [Acidobacteriota bacterium]